MGRELVWTGTDFGLVWMEDSLFGLDGKMAALVGWEEGCLAGQEEDLFGLDKKRAGLVWMGRALAYIGWTVRVLYEKSSGYTAVWLVLGD